MKFTRRNKNQEQPSSIPQAPVPHVQPPIETVVSPEAISLTREEIARGLELDQLRLNAIYKQALERGLTPDDAIEMLKEGVSSGEIPAFAARLPEARDGIKPRLYVPELLKAIERREAPPFPIEISAHSDGEVGVYIRKKTNSQYWRRAVEVSGVDAGQMARLEDSQVAVAALRELLDESEPSQD
ncbi:MAG TPA: hypothetical protein VGE34_03705 [Candidatus Saccharimonadales bacterium]